MPQLEVQPAREETVNIAAYLPRMAADRPFAPAIFFPDGRDSRGRARYVHFTYRQLDEASDRISRGLRAHGVASGTRVALMVRPSLELFSLVFGLFKAGIVPVMIDPGIGLRAMKSCLAKGRPEVFIGIPTAQVARLVLGWGRQSVRTVITVGRFPLGGPTLADIERSGDRSSAPALVSTKADDLAAILFTSGSTGPPKGAVYTHGNFAAQVEAIRVMYNIRPGEIDLPTFPLFALFDPALGMTTVIPEMDPTRPADADPARIAQAIQDFGVTSMFGSPALLNTLARWGERTQTKLPSIRRVISAGAPVPDHVLRRMRSMLSDDADVVTPYGATECLPVATIESREVLNETASMTADGKGVCVGRPVARADVRIIRIDDGPIADWANDLELPTGEIGEITVCAPQATGEYWESERPTALAKIQGGAGVFHRMGDLGYFDDQGRLWFCGRKSQRVEHGGKRWFTAQVEGVFNRHRSVFRSALIKVAGYPVVCVELEKQRPDQSRLLSELRELGAAHSVTRDIARILVHPSFPVDIRHNAKIRREELATWATSRR